MEPPDFDESTILQLPDNGIEVVGNPLSWRRPFYSLMKCWRCGKHIMVEEAVMAQCADCTDFLDSSETLEEYLARSEPLPYDPDPELGD